MVEPPVVELLALCGVVDGHFPRARVIPRFVLILFIHHAPHLDTEITDHARDRPTRTHTGYSTPAPTAQPIDHPTPQHTHTPSKRLKCSAFLEQWWKDPHFEKRGRDLLVAAQRVNSEFKAQAVCEEAREGPYYRGGREVLRPGAADGGELGQEMEKRPLSRG